MIFKGSGFYITDYRSEKYKEAAKKDIAPASSSGAAGQACFERRKQARASQAAKQAGQSCGRRRASLDSSHTAQGAARLRWRRRGRLAAARLPFPGRLRGVAARSLPASDPRLGAQPFRPVRRLCRTLLRPPSTGLWTGNKPGLRPVGADTRTVSCERIKQALMRELGATAPWRGTVYLVLYPARAPGDTITITSERFKGGWQYRVDFPDVVERSRYVRAIVQVLLLEVANRTAQEHAGGDSALAGRRLNPTAAGVQ